ncbi:MAG: ABC transporter permease [Erysipelotrichaceae bacterium]|nr:ABC transporter permease [Erysipelotrichaceae bacterium]
MERNKLKKIFVFILLAYVVMAVSFFFLAGDQLKYKDSSKNIIMMDADSVTDEIVRGVIVEQKFINKVDKIESVAIVFTKFYRQGEGKLTVALFDGSHMLARKTTDLQDVPEQHRFFLEPYESSENLAGKELTLRIYSTAAEGKGAAVMMNRDGAPSGSVIKIGDKTIKGTLCFSVTGADIIVLYQYYWWIVAGIGILLGIFLYISYTRYISGKISYLPMAINAVDRYSFLISQLVVRDFKSKYKRSILGVLWSFLNPLLTMIVQFLVFSTFFKADTKNYPVYLLSGVVCFNFFKETSDMCLISISGNANLINKVYIPKYIFPLARTISSMINLGLSLIPLLLVSLIMGIALHRSVFLMYYFLACLIVFSLGIGMLLSALMVFFRDIQFLWSVIIQIWQYATPIFYPAEIIPAKYKFVVQLNPLYHFIGNLRKCLIDGISPEPLAYLYCFVFAFGMLVIGAFVFKKTQDKFTLYL